MLGLLEFLLCSPSAPLVPETREAEAEEGQRAAVRVGPHQWSLISGGRHLVSFEAAGGAVSADRVAPAVIGDLDITPRGIAARPST